MTITPDVEVEIRRLYFAEHWKRGTIATQLGLHDDVVKRVVGPLGRAARAQNDASVLESFLVFIAETLERYPRLRSTRQGISAQPICFADAATPAVFGRCAGTSPPFGLCRRAKFFSASNPSVGGS